MTAAGETDIDRNLAGGETDIDSNLWASQRQEKYTIAGKELKGLRGAKTNCCRNVCT